MNFPQLKKAEPEQELDSFTLFGPPFDLPQCDINFGGRRSKHDGRGRDYATRIKERIEKDDVHLWPLREEHC